MRSAKHPEQRFKLLSFLLYCLPAFFVQIVKGDGKVFSIAAASILAKVTRDRLMNQHAETYPQYGFDQHKVFARRERVPVPGGFKEWSNWIVGER